MQSLFEPLTRPVIVCLVVVLAGTAVAAEQDPVATPKPAAPRPGSVSVDEAVGLTNGWALLAEKKPDDAAARAAVVLGKYPRSAAALALAVEAELARVGSGAGLAQYERWLGQRQFEEPSLVRRIAVCVLQETAQDARAGAARLEAVRALAADGDDGALKQLAKATVDGNVPEIRVLASLGNEAAVRTLAALVGKGDGNVVAGIEALAASGRQSALAPLSARLKDPAPEVRGAAAQGLGKLGRQYDVAPRIKPLLSDPVSYVRVKAAGALFELGDMSGLQVLQELATADAPVSRLIAAQAMASQPDAQWLDLVRRLTSASEPEIRVGAATLLVPHDPELARSVLEAAASDPNPAIREMAGQTAIDMSAKDLRALRHLLKSTSASARVRAADRILALMR